MAKQAAKKTAAKKPAEKKATKLTVLTCPVEPLVDVVDSEEEMLALIKKRAKEMNIPVSQIPKCGLFRIFAEEIQLTCPEARLETER